MDHWWQTSMDYSQSLESGSALDVSDYLSFDEDKIESSMPHTVTGQSETLVSPITVGADTGHSGSSSGAGSRTLEMGTRTGEGFKVAFRTQSEVDILDDGFKWRKYGKKSVKNSPNPRNYFRCSTEGCSVKKRVERDREDPSYVITSYEGIHNHTSPGVVYYATQDDTSGRFLVSGYSMLPRSSS